MAVPKRKTPRSRTHSRRSANRAIKQPARSVCPNCGVTKRPHVVCPNCGHYKGRQAIEVE
ncbi:MAG: 50S ribosomal protein L32 [Actinobacteria bacterium]|nr:MAG: 50S ribosomal protein L32 [Actinomycetota bacterium]